MSPLELVDDRYGELARELRTSRPLASDRLRRRVEVLARVEPSEPQRRFRPRMMWGASAKRLAVVCAVVAIAVPLVGAGVQGLHDKFQPTDARHSLVGKSPTPQTTETFGAEAAQSARKELAAPLRDSRLQQYDATLRLRVKGVPALSSATRKAMQVARVVGGYVAAVQYSTKAGKRGGASLVLRVPTRTVTTALERLSSLGTILGQHVAILDVQRRADRESREIHRLSADVARLEDLLAPTSLPGTNQAQLRRRLTSERRTLKALRAEQQALLKRAELAKVSLRLSKEADGAGGLFSKTLDDAGSALERELQILLYALIVAGPLLLLGGLAVVAARMQRRHAERRLLERN